MSESNAADGSASTDGQQQVVADGTKTQTVKYETYDKAMASFAKEKAARIELETKLKAISDKEMLEAGNYQQLINQKDKELSDLKNDFLAEKANRIVTSVQSKIAEAAVRMGAYDAGDVIKNISLKDLGIADDGTVDMKVVETKVDEIRKAKQYLFKSASTQTVDGNPVLRPQELSVESMKSMKTSDLLDLYKKL